jgi:hypothetical protein
MLAILMQRMVFIDEFGTGITNLATERVTDS